jgi:hypothetical protein
VVDGVLFEVESIMARLLSKTGALLSALEHDVQRQGLKASWSGWLGGFLL